MKNDFLNLFEATSEQLTVNMDECEIKLTNLNDILFFQEASIHVYEKKGCDRVGRGKRREAIAELLKVNIGVEAIEEELLRVKNGKRLKSKCSTIEKKSLGKQLVSKRTFI